MTSSGLSDPTTTEGDLLVRGASQIERLAPGSDGNVLTMTGGVPGWEIPSGGSGGASALIHDQTLAVATNSVTISGIPGDYAALKIMLFTRNTGSALENIAVTVNGLSNTTQYRRTFMQDVAGSYRDWASDARIGHSHSDTQAANSMAYFELFCPMYAASDVGLKNMLFHGNARQSPVYFIQGNLETPTTAPITSMTFTLSNSALFTVGSRFVVMGMGATGGGNTIADYTFDSPATSHTISGIPATHKNLRVTIRARTTDATTQLVEMYMNGDTTASNYSTYFIDDGSNSGTLSYPFVSFAIRAGGPANYYAPSYVDVPDYATTGQQKTFFYTAMVRYRSTANVTDSRYSQGEAAHISLTAAITSLTFRINGGHSFAAGSRIIITGE
jgi:hypothetical protein